MTYENYYPQTRLNPLVQEAQSIAQEMDYGDSRYAVRRLQEDLHQLQNYPDAQKQLIGLVERMERKGQGADVEAELVRMRNGTMYADVRAVEYRYVSDGYQTWREPCSRLPIAAIYIDQNFGPQNYYNRQYGMPRQQFDPRRQHHQRFMSQENQHHQFIPQNYQHQRFMPQQYAQRQPAHWQGHGHDGPRLHGLAPEASSALAYAQQLAARDGVRIDVSSGFRTFQEQSYLYRTSKGPVAKPGTSNHERGIALDIRNYKQAKPYLLAAGFTHGDGRGPIPGDPWHFKYVG